MKQLNNQNNIFSLNDMKENLSNNLINQKNFIMNLNTIIDINSSGIKDLIPLFESINKILPELINYLGIPFCDINVFILSISFSIIRDGFAEFEYKLITTPDGITLLYTKLSINLVISLIILFLVTIKTYPNI